MLDKLKMLLGVQDDAQDGLLEFALDTARSLILGYCNIDRVPKALETVMLRMAMDVYRAAGLGAEQAPQTVQSVKRGDVTTTYSVAGSTGSTSDSTGILASYERELRPFRKLRW